MKKLGPILALAVAAVIGYVLIGGGSLSKGGASGGNTDALHNGGQQVVDKGQGYWLELVSKPWFYTAAAAVILAIIGFMTWKRIGNWGRMLAMLLLGVGIAIFLFKLS